VRLENVRPIEMLDLWDQCAECLEATFFQGGIKMAKGDARVILLCLLKNGPSVGHSRALVADAKLLYFAIAAKHRNMALRITTHQSPVDSAPFSLA